MASLVIPILPSRDLAATAAFYARAGFQQRGDFPDYLILFRHEAEIHFYRHPHLKPTANDAGLYIRTDDVEAWVARFEGLPRFGIPRADALEAKPWGMLEFAVIDPDGNLLRIGREIGAPKSD